MLKRKQVQNDVAPAINLRDECSRAVEKLLMLDREEPEITAQLIEPQEPDWERLGERLAREKDRAARGDAGADVPLIAADVAQIGADYEDRRTAFEARKPDLEKRLREIRRERAVVLGELHPLRLDYRRHVIAQLMEWRGEAGNRWANGPLAGAADVAATYLDLHSIDWLLERGLGESVGRFEFGASLVLPGHTTFGVRLPKVPAPDSLAARAQALVDEYRVALAEFA